MFTSCPFHVSITFTQPQSKHLLRKFSTKLLAYSCIMLMTMFRLFLWLFFFVNMIVSGVNWMPLSLKPFTAIPYQHVRRYLMFSPNHNRSRFYVLISTIVISIKNKFITIADRHSSFSTEY